jgi:tetratricopeptide (TPR) repeat protein
MRAWLLFALLNASVALAGQHPETISLLERPLFAPPLAREEREKREDALREARAGFDRDSSNVDAVLALARAQMSLGRVGDSLETLTRALELKPDDAGLLLERGRGLVVIRKFPLAARELRKASATIPEAHCALGVAEYLSADYPRAREAFSQCTDAGVSPVFPYLADWRTGPSAMPRPSLPREPGPDPSTSIRMPGTPVSPVPSGHMTLAASYLEAAENLIQGKRGVAKDQLKRIVDKNLNEWMDPVYIAAEADYARILKTEGRKRKKEGRTPA